MVLPWLQLPAAAAAAAAMPLAPSAADYIIPVAPAVLKWPEQPCSDLAGMLTGNF
jgi:hypothetical protein